MRARTESPSVRRSVKAAQSNRSLEVSATNGSSSPGKPETNGVRQSPTRGRRRLLTFSSLFNTGTFCPSQTGGVYCEEPNRGGGRGPEVRKSSAPSNCRFRLPLWAFGLRVEAAGPNRARRAAVVAFVRWKCQTVQIWFMWASSSFQRFTASVVSSATKARRPHLVSTRTVPRANTHREYCR